MPRPKASENQRRRAYELWSEARFGPTPIHQALKKEFEETDDEDKYEEVVSLRTVKNWLREFRDLREEVTQLDEGFEWHRLEEYGLPWEAGRYLLDTWSAATKFWRDVAEKLEDRNPPLPTVRQVRWWWWVHLALPEERNFKDIILWAEAFVRYELLRDVFGETVDMAGMTAYLSLRPWKRGKSRTRYAQAVSEGRFPRLPDSFEEVMLLDRTRFVEDATYSPVGFDLIPLDLSKRPSKRLAEWMDRRLAQKAAYRKAELELQELESEHGKGAADEGPNTTTQQE